MPIFPVPEAPTDGKQYARADRAWDEITPVAEYVVFEPSGVLADYRAEMQSQWDAAASAGKALLIPAGTYPLTITGGGYNQYSLKPADASIRYDMYIAPGAELKLADDQLADSVDDTPNSAVLIYYEDHTGGSYIGWPFGGRGGKMTGNTANQPRWTTKHGEQGTRYTQYIGSGAIYGLDTLTNGSFNITVEWLEIADFFGHAVMWLGHSGGTAYDAGAHTFHFRNLYSWGLGECYLVASVRNVHWYQIEHVATADVLVGDVVEPSHCLDFSVDQVDCYTDDGNPIGSGGAAVDTYASKRGTISNVRCAGLVNGITLQSDFTNPTIEFCDDIAISNCVIKDVWSQCITPAENGTSSWSNIIIDGRGSDSGSSYAIDLLIATDDAVVIFDNVTLINGAKPIGLGKGTYIFSNVSLIDTVATTPAINISNVNPVLDWNNVTCNASLNFGLSVDGTSAPTGTIRSCNFAATVPKRQRDTATLAGVQIDGGLVGTMESAREINSTHQDDTQPQQGFTNYYGTTSTDPVDTFGPGCNNAEITINARYQACNFVHGAGDIRLAGGVDANVPQGGFISFRYVGSLWYETGRSTILLDNALNKFTRIQGYTVQVLPWANFSNHDVDTLSGICEMTLTDNVTWFYFQIGAGSDGMKFQIDLIQDATGGRTFGVDGDTILDPNSLLTGINATALSRTSVYMGRTGGKWRVLDVIDLGVDP